MSKIDNVASYMDGIAELRDELCAIGTEVEDWELVSAPLNGLYHLGGFFFRASMLERQCRPSPGSRMTWCGKNSSRSPIQRSKRRLKGFLSLGGLRRLARKGTRRRKARGQGRRTWVRWCVSDATRSPTVDRETNKSHLHRRKDPTFDYLIQLVLWG